MASNVTSVPTGVHFEKDEKPKYERQIIWPNVVVIGGLHIGTLYSMYLMVTSARLSTSIFTLILGYATGLGTTAGSHRLWSHKSYKAKWPLRLLLMILQTAGCQNSVIKWARDHRVHHKYCETDADPHNAKRGFFFAHVGWLLCREHPDVKEKSRAIDISDLRSDPILAFQKKHYLWLMPLLAVVIPLVIPVYFWSETWWNAFFVSPVWRWTASINVTSLVNSAAHLYGSKPYDKFINPADNKLVSALALGEGWHNYHHVFPWDYKTAELGDYSYNYTTMFIDFFAKIGWAYDLKTVSTDMIQKRVERTGDGSHDVWGWGDKDQSQEERDQALITHKRSQ